MSAMIHQIPRLIKIHDQIVGNGAHYWDTPAKCVNFAASLQRSDITKDLMYNVNKSTEYPFRRKVNIRRIDLEYCQKGVAEGRTITYKPAPGRHVEQIERRTSNVQHRILNDKRRETQTVKKFRTIYL